MKRRDLIKSTLAIGSASALSAGCAGSTHQTGKKLQTPNKINGRVFNESKAREILELEQIDGLIALSSVNVFYLSNYRSFYSRMQRPFPNFAVFAPQTTDSTTLITSSADNWAVTNGGNDHPRIVPYTLPIAWQEHLEAKDWTSEPAAAGYFGAVWPWNEPTLSEREQRWREADKALGGDLAPTAVYALARVLRESGLAKARVAVDDMRIVDQLTTIGFDTTRFIAGDNVFRKIRVVKSANEVDRMRQVATANQHASAAAIRQFEPGMIHTDIEHLFTFEAAKLGAKAMWLVAGGVGGLRNGELRPGEPLLFDAVSQVEGYHGDFGRTVILDTPQTKTRQRVALINKGWQAALNMMRPGVRYSEIQRVARAAMNSDGPVDAKIAVTPHSVGLQHTDEPYRDGLPYAVKDDLILEENMTLTVDFPSMEIGWGSCHLEDLVRITSDGVEALGQIDDALVVV